MTGIPTDCRRCTLPLDARNLTGLCRECKHILRDARAGFTAPEVTVDEARTNFMAVFPDYRHLDTSAVYMRGACRRCARFAARRDTGCCEWCSGPTRFPSKRRKNRPAAKRTAPDGSVPPEIPARGSLHPTARKTSAVKLETRSIQ